MQTINSRNNGRMNKVLILIGLIGGLAACSQPSLDKRLDDYCLCQQAAVESGESRVPCMEMAGEIADEYAFDPEASERIQKRIVDCAGTD